MSVRQNWSVRRYTTPGWAGFAVVLAAITVGAALAPRQHRAGADAVLTIAPFVFGFFCLVCAVQCVRSFALDRPPPDRPDEDD